MKSLVLIVISLTILGLTGCYTIEDADNVNQQRIATHYSTVFNATRNTTNTQIDFRFGQTPLRLNNPIYFEGLRLYEEQDPIFGLQYERQIGQVLGGYYEWTDETGLSYFNLVEVFEFTLIHGVDHLKKGVVTELPWAGDQIPYGQGHFTVTIQSYENNLICTFSMGQKIEILPEHLEALPQGRALLTISRSHSEPIDEGTQAGGESTVSYQKEYEITILE